MDILKRKHLYLGLCIVGFIIPYYYFIHFLMNYGMDINSLFNQLFSNYISSFFGVDVIISAITLICFICFEGKRLKIKYFWIPIIGTLTVGVFFGLPLFLYIRERYINNG